MKELYQILETDEKMSDLDITKKYKELVKKYHPDNNIDKDTTKKFTEINTAYEKKYGI